ncbi:MAG: hypothetical protein ACI37S_08180 [Candidatus Gastranaerophilaceae bacterium]
MTPTNPRVPDFLGIYKPANNTSTTTTGEPAKNNNTQDAIFNFGENSQVQNGLGIEKQSDSKPKQELSLKEQKAQAKAQLKELKEIARALKKEAAKKDASDEVKQAAIQAQKDVDAQAKKTYQIRKAYAKSIGQEFDSGHKTKANHADKKADSKPQPQNEVKEQYNKPTQKPTVNPPESKPTQNFIKKLKTQLTKNIENTPVNDSESTQISEQKQTQNSTPMPKNYSSYKPEQTSSTQVSLQNSTPMPENYSSYKPEEASYPQASFMPEENNVCDERARYSSQYELSSDTNPVQKQETQEPQKVEPDKNGKIVIEDKDACNEFEKASKKEMKGAFSVQKINNGESCEVDFDANTSNTTHDVRDNSTLDDIIDYFTDENKLDYSTVDGKLGEYYQGLGDCYLLTSVRDSQVDLSKLITSKGGDNKPPYEVKFPTQDKKLQPYATQIVTAEDLEKNNFSKGDVDVRIIEVALNKAIGKQVTNKIAELSKQTGSKQKLREAVRKALVDVELPNKPKKVAFLEGGSVVQTKEILTGTKRQIHYLAKEDPKDIEQLIKAGTITALGIHNTSSVNIGWFDKNKLISGHSYSIKDVKTDANGKTTFTIYSNWEPSGFFGSYSSLESKENVTLEDLMKHKDNIILQ